MWIFITARPRQWLILTVIVPLVTTLIHVIWQRLEAKSGPTPGVRTRGTRSGPR